jgi:uncharacterized membrane protein YfcA
MTLPSLLLGMLFSSFYGALFHLWKGGSLWKLVLLLLLAWGGFWAGHIAAELLGWTFLSIGPLHLGLATIVSWIVLFIGYWLSLVKPVESPKKK